MKNRLLRYYRLQQFQPDSFGLFLNPFYLIRRALFKEIFLLGSRLNGKMLDFGCGSKPYRNLFQVSEYIGVDMENEGHSHEQESVDVFYDGQTLPFSDNSFDSCLCSEVLEHTFDPDKALSEIHRVLKPGALFLVTVPFVWNEHEVPNDAFRYTQYGMKHLLNQQGFEVIEMRQTGNFISVLYQMRALYMYRRIVQKIPIINLFLIPFFVSPFLISGRLMSRILPRDRSLYFNVVALARTRK